MLSVISVFLKESIGKQGGGASSLGGVWGEGAQREGIQPGVAPLREGGSKDQSVSVFFLFYVLFLCCPFEMFGVLLLILIASCTFLLKCVSQTAECDLH